MAEWWDTRNTKWEQFFDEIVEVAASRRLSTTLNLIKRLRGWQHRQALYGNENHRWHDAELLWLQGVVLERARQRTKAKAVWQRLARILESDLNEESWFLPKCPRCAERELGFATNWFTVASELRGIRTADQSLPQLLSARASARP